MNLGNRKLKATTGFVLIESKEHEAGEQVTKGGIVLLQKKNIMSGSKVLYIVQVDSLSMVITIKSLVHTMHL